jgi:hypothetical protein
MSEILGDTERNKYPSDLNDECSTGACRPFAFSTIGLVPVPGDNDPGSDFGLGVAGFRSE